MKTSTEIQSIADIVGEEKAVELVAKAGFDAWDFSMFSMKETEKMMGKHPLMKSTYLDFARQLKKIGMDNGIHCNQSHAPFPSFDKNVKPYLERAIECTAEAGGKICVIHPDNNRSPEENAELFMEILPFAKACGVKIATENMWNWDVKKDQASFAACATPDSFNAHLDVVNDDFFVACLDIGHAEMRGCNTSAVEMIQKLGSRLQALHIHDNDRHYDSHQIPFSMDVDFVEVVKALKQIGYSGYFTLEADQFLNGFHADNVLDGVRQLAQSVKRLSDMFEQI